MKLVVSLLVSVTLMGGCGTLNRKMPETSQEFRKLIEEGARFTSITDLSSNKPYRKVVKQIKKRGLYCFNVTIRGSSSASPSPMFSSARHTTYHKYSSSFKRLGNGSSELVVRTFARGTIGPKMPRGGYFRVVVDIKAAKGNKTKIKIYSSRFGRKKLVRSITGWANLNDSKCPKFAGPGKYLYSKR